MKRHILEHGDGMLKLARKPSKSGIVFGIPMLGLGSLVLMLGLLTVFEAAVNLSGSHVVAGLLMTAVGAGFSVIGALVMFARSGTIFDAKEGSIRQWFRLLIYSRVVETPLAGLNQVVVAEHLWKGRPRYSLSLVGTSRLEIMTTRRHRDVVELADQIAQLFALGPVRNLDKSEAAELSM